VDNLSGLFQAGFRLLIPKEDGQRDPGWTADPASRDLRSTLYNTDGQIFSDSGIPAVLFMENYDLHRQGYNDTHDTMENIDLDYGSALAAIAIETVARPRPKTLLLPKKEKVEPPEKRPDRMPCITYDLLVKVQPWEFGSSPM